MSDKHRNFRWAWINSIRRLKLILNVAQRLESHHCVTEILVKPRAHRRPEAQRSTSTAEQQRGEIKGRVEDRLAPALPHQTVHAVLRVFASQNPCLPRFPHTAFRCSSHQGMRRFPARSCGNFVQPTTPVQVNTRKAAFAYSSVSHLVALHQVDAQPLFRVDFDLFQTLI